MLWKSNHHPVTSCEEEHGAWDHLTLTPMQPPNFIVFNKLILLESLYPILPNNFFRRVGYTTWTKANPWLKEIYICHKLKSKTDLVQQPWSLSQPLVPNVRVNDREHIFTYWFILLRKKRTWHVFHIDKTHTRTWSLLSLVTICFNFYKCEWPKWSCKGLGGEEKQDIHMTWSLNSTILCTHVQR